MAKTDTAIRSLAPNRKPDQTTKDRIIELARQGMPIILIATDLNLQGQVVSGIVSNARRRGLLSLPVNKAPQPQSVPRQPMPPMPPGFYQDNFIGGRPIVGGSGGFTAPSLEVKYTVERTVPPDGLLGVHYTRFSVEELGKEYGEGTYKILKHEPGRALPMEFIQKVASSYGQPRCPRSATPASSVMPTKMVERSILNRLMECRQVLDSATAKMKLKKIDPSVIKGETDFLLSTIKDIGSLLGHLSRHSQSKADIVSGGK